MHDVDKLYVYVATPVITTHPKSVVSKTGSTDISLSCTAHDYGVGRVRYKWEKYQQSDRQWSRAPYRQSNVSSPTMPIDVVTEEDEGVFRCVATNDDGSVVSENATVTVYGESK